MAEDEFFGQVAVVLAALVLFEHGELVEDVGGVVFVEAVEVEEERVMEPSTHGAEVALRDRLHFPLRKSDGSS